MLIKVQLLNGAGVLDTVEFDIKDDDSAEVSEAIWDAIDSWILAPGDTIVIHEVTA